MPNQALIDLYGFEEAVEIARLLDAQAKARRETLRAIGGHRPAPQET
jgi:hypothetical protein